MEAAPKLLRILFNLLMQARRACFLNAGTAKTAKVMPISTIRTQAGEITFAIPQVSEGVICLSALLIT
jgi:hypothetical protein